MPLTDKFGRPITDLRISITDRCNYKCVYCRTGNEGALYGDLPFSDYLRIARVLVGMGIRKIRLTGGEPLLRNGVVGFVRELAQLHTPNATNGGDPLDMVIDDQYYLSRTWLAARKLDQKTVEEVLAAWLKKQPYVQTAYTRTQLLGDLSADDALAQRVKKSYYPGHSGDVLLVVKPYSILWGSASGTTHGSPHPYDTHVPLLLSTTVSSGPRTI